MTSDRIAFTIIALTAIALLAYGLAHATSATDYTLLSATGAVSAILLGLLTRPNNR